MKQGDVRIELGVLVPSKLSSSESFHLALASMSQKPIGQAPVQGRPEGLMRFQQLLQPSASGAHEDVLPLPHLRDGGYVDLFGGILML